MRPKVVAVTLLAFVTAACAHTPAGARSTPATPAIAHPTGADQLVLRVELLGGFVAPETTFARTPSFSLMGDGTTIEPGGQTEIYPGQALPPPDRSHDLRGRDPGDPRSRDRRRARSRCDRR